MCSKIGPSLTGKLQAGRMEASNLESDPHSSPMTLVQFIAKNVFRNRRRSVLTALSVTFSLLLLTIMMAVWRGFYIDQGAPDSALRIMTRHRVSLAFFLPGYYREKIRAVPGVTHVVPMTWFGGKYKDDRPENFFAQFATDPAEYMEVAADKIVPPEQITAWQQDRTGCLVDQALAAKHGWKIGDRVVVLRNIWRNPSHGSRTGPVFTSYAWILRAQWHAHPAISMICFTTCRNLRRAK